MAKAELIDRARELRPLLAAGGAQGDADRHLADKTVAALADAGLFKIMVPRRYGGRQADIRTLVEVASEVAEADGATGWVLALTSACAWVTALFPGSAQDEVFGVDPDALVCGSGSPLGTGTPTAGGWMLSGRWPYISGSWHAQWATLGFLMPGAEGGPREYGIALVPMAQLTLIDTWSTTGMRGTGSNTLTAEDVFVPRHRILPGSAISTSDYPTEFKDETPYRAALYPALTTALIGPLLGIGRAALDHVRIAAATKRIAATAFPRQADSVGFQLQLAEAAMRVDTATLHAFRAADEIDAFAADRSHPDVRVRTRIRADIAWAARQLVDAAGILVDAHGSGAFAEANPLRRMCQDLNIGARHALIGPAVSLELHGKALLGVANDITVAI